ncbi:uncharacterized protein DUF4064 [Natranaerovirga hydrolytica]|uniref:Uncharacterized protein DUF4064 n=1 Tax=Natranaerovirga hydrolytica TaxID=680378 RepID=A0A4R1MMD6_9FIRM|nr:DUF4064 domain-containing protein [Natranaerovirga hydrolytica]TCK93260.1 uncharacterized protein DUF4064 [Natranaerovirga hydrolytica]
MDNKISRTPEFVLGIVGSIFNGIWAAYIIIISVIFTTVGNAVYYGAGNILGGVAIILGLLLTATTVAGIIATVKVKSNINLAGWIFIASAIIILLVVGMSGIIVTALYLTAGLMSILRKDPQE